MSEVKIFAAALILVAMTSVFTPAFSVDNEDVPGLPVSCISCERFNHLNTLIRDGRIDADNARREILSLLPSIERHYRENGGRSSDSPSIFPLKGYGPGAIATGKSHGYSAAGYDFFDGNRHGGHPSLDIFIHDKDQDCRDDVTGDRVEVLSVRGGIVVASENEWLPGSALRGGKYLWIYDPDHQELLYYAHNSDLKVAVGDVVKQGEVIAHVGRTGFNAAKRRSPTHLHLTCITIDGGKMRPRDIYPELRTAKTVR